MAFEFPPSLHLERDSEQPDPRYRAQVSPPLPRLAV